MPDKKEKERQNEIHNGLRKKYDEEFENSLPMSKGKFKKLFDYMDLELRSRECDDTNRIAKSFFEANGVDNPYEVLEWIAVKGGYCDCEILANVEEQFG